MMLKSTIWYLTGKTMGSEKTMAEATQVPKRAKVPQNRLPMAGSSLKTVEVVTSLTVEDQTML